MKWFKHETRRNAKLKRIIMEFGMEGYGLYWLCLELISGSISIDNLTFELEEDAELIAHEFKIDTIKVARIMHRCIELGLFELSDNGRLSCLSLAKLLDETVTKNQHVKEIKKKITEKLNIDQINDNSGVILETLRPDKKRREENRIDKNRLEKRFKKPTITEIQDHLNEKGITTIDPEYFYNYYESKDWMIGKNRMKCWKSAIQTWIKREKDFKKQQPKPFNQRSAFVETMTPEIKKEIASFAIEDRKQLESKK